MDGVLQDPGLAGSECLGRGREEEKVFSEDLTVIQLFQTKTFSNDLQ